MRLLNIFLSKKGMGSIEVTPKEQILPKEESNLVIHARRELSLLGEDPETINGYLKIVAAFADMGHSGGSASVAIPTLAALLQYKNLKPLTDSPEEWVHVGDATPDSPNVWQSSRNSEAFSNDGGKTYYLLSECNRRKPKKMHDSIPFGELHEADAEPELSVELKLQLRDLGML